jgi:Spy/CpxP family protein refolding chaperone
MNRLINRPLMPLITATHILLALLLLGFSAASIRAQGGDSMPPGEAEQSVGNQGGELGRVLGLTREQFVKIRMIRQEHQEERRLAGERLRNAQRALDEAIYSDNNSSEALIEERARELAAAQAATIRLRALTELSIRRVLTPEQLTILRTLRLRQGQQRRLGREMNLQQRLRGDRPPRDTGGVPPSRRDRFRQRENAPLQQRDGNRPAGDQRDRRP